MFKFYAIIITIFFLSLSQGLSFEQNQTILSFQQFFSNNICFHEQTSLNQLHARGIDVNDYKKYDIDYGDHSKVEPIQLNQDEYLVGSKLGSGKFSDVYLGYNKSNNYEKILIKILRPNKIEKVQREISILTKVNSIENVPKFYGITVDKYYQVPSLFFEYIQGNTLKNIIQRFNEIDIRYYSYILIETIYQAHKIGVIHRDIKSANIIINHEKRVLKVIDWGLSDIYFPYSFNFCKIGTVNYKAPELILTDSYHINITPAVDIWASGVIIFQMMINSVPLIKGHNSYTALLDIIKIFGYKDVMRLSSWSGIPLNPQIYKEIQENKIYTEKGKGLKQLIDQDNVKYADPLGLDLIDKMLKILPNERISAKEALDHPYFDKIRQIIQTQRKNQNKKKG
ncbi:cyclin-dependent kinase-like Serine/Threonine kinase family protein (macronuclear) [Tetrahymena thermophila SB210]|uniref:non-specific serine/threonine protein kinase n=1 Tax=Tetrahymena thermophila (strain SB210) TaxID=312017 RepID=Q22A74_TETTS|nr:cyclin-dependent kinase-like Serine/Threonine kinase family protein [Tetrahymena thermophila SB210]EAR82183.2 cyclin-dependent kinase-like Serine/Threonine kinase family protein [Tetrahymena thermophila SB210]|eukprot:XP_001029846.2 cyclin-dependent kinase-like Serine/Threonine kinase family protein [Tetrahymena thermophila SB210]